MIAIVNVGSTSVSESHDPCGERNYQVKINHTLVANFRHHRRDGLAVCLEKAAAAVRAAKEQQ